ncbi:hypothetical protein ACFQZ4_13180 [Catellatospora coxensis]|uniref:Uncharacterized protein n=1 Tax=Catellatospora coxensis TaxID=310354 RepID=A0A8J3PAV6_9ACTN|nr:hypothetical protein [Catellatospora coxensis]GIG08216.1 hypothetical protein Cco03nite_49160 [Catellatospora coxensis]
MLTRLRRRIGWWAVPVEVLALVGVIQLSLVALIAVLGSEPGPFSWRMFLSVWVFFAAVGTASAWWDRRRGGQEDEPAWRARAPRRLLLGIAIADVWWSATVAASGLSVYQGGLGLWCAVPLTALGVFPLVLLRHLAGRYEQAETAAS